MKIQTTKDDGCFLAIEFRKRGWMTLLYKDQGQPPGIITLETTCYGEEFEEVISIYPRKF